MALLDRLRPGADTKTISFHAFGAAGYLLAEGDISLAQYKTILGLDASDDAQVNKLVAFYQALPDNRAKDKFKQKMDALGDLWEGGYITEAQYIAGLGLT